MKRVVFLLASWVIYSDIITMVAKSIIFTAAMCESAERANGHDLFS